MRWRQKALIQKTFSRLPGGDYLYRLVQKRFGTLDSDPWFRLPHLLAMLRAMGKAGFDPAGKAFFEVGSGHKPIMPLGFFLAGAAKVTTVDLNRRMDPVIVLDMLGRMNEDAARIRAELGAEVPAKLIEPRLKALRDFQGSLQQLLELTRIEYLAPADAAHTDLKNESIDCHFSTTTLEHISLPVLHDIFREARRLLKPDGVAVHFIDLSDHYQHQDPTISKINFLKYSAEEWQKIAGNRFAYTNRLRAPDFRRMFAETGFEPILEDLDVDPESLDALAGGFKPDAAFRGLSPQDLCTTGMQLVMRKKNPA